MPDISRLLKRHAKWLRSYMLCEGDILEIVDAGFMDHRYGRARLVVTVRDGNGVTRYLPLSQRNLRILAKAYGTDTSHWPGKKIKVREIRYYPVLNAEGLILEPILDEQETRGDSKNFQAEIEKADWRPGRYGGEIVPSSELPTLSQELQRRKMIGIGGYLYRLSRNRKWIVRSSRKER